MLKALIREQLIELMDQGLLTGNDIEFFNEPLLARTGDTEYRPDGYSHEHRFGCRRHRVIDQRLAELREGDKIERELAGTFPAWYSFDPMDLGDFRSIRDYMASEPEAVYPFEVEDEEERNIARRAAWLARIRALEGGRPQLDVAHSFSRSEDTDGDGKTEHIVVPGHRVVVSGRGKQSQVTQRWPEQALINIESALEAMRNPHGL